jgi:hypothetical protein
MKLNKDQIKIVKCAALYVGGSIIGYLLYHLITGKAWGDFFTNALISIIVGLVVGGLLVFGSKVPKKKDE